MHRETGFETAEVYLRDEFVWIGADGRKMAHVKSEMHPKDDRWLRKTTHGSSN